MVKNNKIEDFYKDQSISYENFTLQELQIMYFRYKKYASIFNDPWWEFTSKEIKLALDSKKEKC